MEAALSEACGDRVPAGRIECWIVNRTRYGAQDSNTSNWLMTAVDLNKGMATSRVCVCFVLDRLRGLVTTVRGGPQQTGRGTHVPVGRRKHQLYELTSSGCT